MTPLFDYTTDWTLDERNAAATLLARAAGCLKVFAAIHPEVATAKELADSINAALGLKEAA